ncbi:MAG: PAS domain S-box protein [Gemmatimonadaceae bacterium]
MAGLLTRVSTRWPVAGPYLIGIGALGLFTYVRYVLDPLLGNHYPNILFLLAVLLTARLGGWKPGMVVLVLSYVIADFMFSDPRYHLLSAGFDHQVGAIMFLSVGVAGILLSQSERDVRRRVDAAQRDLQTQFDEVQRGHARYLSVVDALGEIVTINDLNGEITSNQNWTEVTGQSYDAAIRGGWASIIHPEDAAGVQERWAVGLKTFQPVDSRFRMKRADGQWRRMHSRAIPVRNSAGTVVEWVRVIKDETQSRQIDELLQSVLDNALDVIVSVGASGNVESFNQAGQRLFGYEQSEVIGHSVTLILPDTKSEGTSGKIPWYLSAMTGRVNTLERQMVGRRSDGSRIPLEVAFSAFELNGALHYTGILRDLTEKSALEAQLRQSQKMEAFGQLAGGVAHDFNNLLTIIIGCSDMLLPSLQRSDPAHELVTDIRTAGDRAAALTRQLLAFSRRQLLEPKIINLNETVADVEKMLRRLIGEDVLLASNLDASLQPVRVDPGQIEQVLVNLAVNARDAMPHGGQLTIETRNVVWTEEYCRVHLGYMPGRYVMISMTDTGTGMTPDVKRRVFEPFFTTKGAGKGTGLGLATVFGIVRQSGGQVNLYSEVNVGTSLQVYLPAIEQSNEAEPVRENLDAMRMGSETILLVEDEEAVRKIAKLALESHGYSVVEASSGAEALAIAEKFGKPIDLVISDVVMPGMSGRQFAETLRKKRTDFRLLFISGYTDDAVVRHGIVQADEAFLQKPFSPNTLARKVREVLDRPA